MQLKRVCSIVAAATVMLSGCATIIEGTDQNVSFESEPSGATVRVDGRVIGQTPLSSRLDKKSGQIVTFESPGYKTVTQELATKTAPWFFGNIISGGLFGSTTDFASGAAYEYSPQQYFVTLPPANSAGLLNGRQQIERYIVVVYDELRSAAAKGQPETNETFDGLLRALNVDPGDSLRVDMLSKLLIDNPNPVSGANAIANKFYGS